MYFGVFHSKSIIMIGLCVVSGKAIYIYQFLLVCFKLKYTVNLEKDVLSKIYWLYMCALILNP